MGEGSPPAHAHAAASGGANPAIDSALPTPGVLRRLAAMAYELLLLAAILFISTYLFLIPGLTLDDAIRRPLLQIYVLAVCGVYFVWLWRHGGQTLPMKTWRIRLVDAAGGRVSLTQAIARYLLACLLIPPAGAAVLWAMFDPDRQFLHDRLAGTRIVSVAD